MSFPVCDDCTGLLLEVIFKDCPVDWNQGQIGVLYVANVGYPIVSNPLVDPAAFAAEFNARISNSSMDPTKIRKLIVIGEKPAPSENELTLAGNKKIVTSKEHVINADVDQISVENYNALVRQAECGDNFLLWYENGKMLFGGNENFQDGILVSLRGNLVIPKDIKAIDTIPLTIKWEQQYSPLMIENPLN